MQFNLANGVGNRGIQMQKNTTLGLALACAAIVLIDSQTAAQEAGNSADLSVVAALAGRRGWKNSFVPRSFRKWARHQSGRRICVGSTDSNDVFAAE